MATMRTKPKLKLVLVNITWSLFTSRDREWRLM